MIFDIYYDEGTGTYSVRNGRTGELLVKPAAADDAVAELAALGYTMAVEDIQEGAKAAIPTAAQKQRWVAEADALRAERGRHEGSTDAPTG